MSKLEFVFNACTGQNELTQIRCIIALGGLEGIVPAVFVAMVDVGTRLKEGGAYESAFVQCELRRKVQ
jgi:hypothetical protein